jgi:hypothetical protein
MGFSIYAVNSLVNASFKMNTLKKEKKNLCLYPKINGLGKSLAIRSKLSLCKLQQILQLTHTH